MLKRLLVNFDTRGRQLFHMENYKGNETTKWYLLLLAFLTCIWVILDVFKFDFVSYVRKCRLAASLPGPPALPIIGNTHHIMKFGVQNFLAICNKYIDKYGTVFRFWAGPIPVIVIAEPDYIKEVFAAEDVEKCPFFYGFIETILSNNLFVTTDKTYREKRKRYDTFFNLRVVEKAYHYMEEYSMQLIERLEKRQGETLDLYKVISVTTGKTIMDSSRGFNLSSDEEVAYYTNGLERAVKAIYSRAMKPLKYNEFFYRLSSTGRKEINELRKLKRDFLEMTLQHRKIFKEQEFLALNNNVQDGTEKSEETFLDYLVKLWEAGSLETDAFESELAFLTASGTETSALTLSYCLLMLAMHPEIQQSLYDELRAAASSEDCRQLTREQLMNCHLLERVIKEVLRHVAPPVVPRVTRHTLVIDKHLVVPPNTSLALCVNVMHRNPKYYSHPKIFYPDHFLPENVAARPPNAFIPFITGIRKCPGYKYAMSQMRVVISTVILNYTVTTNLKYREMKFEFSLLLKLCGPYAVQLHKRQKPNVDVDQMTNDVPTR